MIFIVIMTGVSCGPDDWKTVELWTGDWYPGCAVFLLVSQWSRAPPGGQSRRPIRERTSSSKLGNVFNWEHFWELFIELIREAFTDNQTPFSGECRPWSPAVIIYFGKYFVVCYEIFLLALSCDCFLHIYILTPLTPESRVISRELVRLVVWEREITAVSIWDLRWYFGGLGGWPVTGCVCLMTGNGPIIVMKIGQSVWPGPHNWNITPNCINT